VSTRFEPGAPAREGGIPLSVPEIRGNEWQYIRECLDTNFVSSVGPFVTRFEETVAAYLDAPHAVATVTGTAAIHVALEAAGVRRDDAVLISALTFIAPANAIRYAGAWPVFIDAEPEYWQMDPAVVEAYLRHGCERKDGGVYDRHTGRRVSAIVPVHILGHPVDLDPILALAREFQLAVIEDATESLGASYRGHHVGNPTSAGLPHHAACLSFNGNKLITTGGGGMVVSRDAAFARRVKYLTTQAKDDALEFVHGEVGYNYRLTNIQAALGVAQMEQIEAFLAAKRAIADRYRVGLGDVPGVTLMPEAPWASSALWLSTVLVDAPVFGATSRELVAALDAVGVQARPLWQPVHLSPAHRGHVSPACPVAERLNRDAVSLPSSVGLTAVEQQRVIALVRQACRGAR